MNKNEYKECHRLSESDNEWMEYYNNAWCEDKQTKLEERKHDSLGYHYTNNDEWYYQYDRDEQHWYVVVDL